MRSGGFWSKRSVWPEDIWHPISELLSLRWHYIKYFISQRINWSGMWDISLIHTSFWQEEKKDLMILGNTEEWVDSLREKKANVMRLIQDTVQLQSQQGLVMWPQESFNRSIITLYLWSEMVLWPAVWHMKHWITLPDWKVILSLYSMIIRCPFPRMLVVCQITWMGFGRHRYTQTWREVSKIRSRGFPAGENGSSIRWRRRRAGSNNYLFRECFLRIWESHIWVL